MNLEALQQLFRVVCEAPDDMFCMAVVSRRTGCGTVHCAAGWAGLDEWFNDRGLRLVADHECYSSPEINKVIYETPDGHKVVGTKALRLFFDLDEYDAERLFFADGNVDNLREAPSKGQVLENIDRVLNGEPAFTYSLGEDE